MDNIYIFISTIISSVLAFIGGMMMIVYYIYYPTDRAVSHLFCMWLGISAVGLSSTTFVIMDGVDNGHVLCTIFPMIENYFILSSSFITVIIAVRIRKIVFQEDGCMNLADAHLKKYFAFVWIAPLVLVFLPLTTGSYGRNDADVFCFMHYDSENEKDNNIALVWVLSVFYCPVLLSVTSIIVIYRQCVTRIKELQTRDNAMRSRLNSMIRKIQIYPLIFIAVLIVPLCHRCRSLYGINDPKWVDMLAYNSWKLQGFFDSVAYGSTTNMHIRFTESLRKKFDSFLIFLSSDSSSSRSSKIEISGISSGTVKNELIVGDQSSMFTLRDSA